MTKKTKLMSNQIEMEESIVLKDKIITFNSKGVEVQLDSGKLSKKVIAKLKSAQMSLQLGQLRYLVPEKGSIGGLGYITSKGTVSSINFDTIAKSVIVPVQAKQSKGYKGLDVIDMQMKYLYTMFPKMVEKLKVKDVIYALEWAVKAKNLGVKVPGGWAIIEERWIKTIKILTVSQYLINYYNTYENVPAVKALRCLINNIDNNMSKIVLTSNPKEFSGLIKNKLIMSENINEIKGEHEHQDVTILLQEGGLGVVPGATVSFEDDNERGVAEIPSSISCDLCVCKVTDCTANYDTMQKIYNSSILVVYLPWCKRLESNSNFKLTRSQLEDIKLIAQKIAIALQYPLEYINWKK